ncbi:unnamed protein product [Aphis gossypii]|uniref:Uncharacterized protein n=1 Tax=Aphis gossypii TaxID=80765 RepID=A0A9P0NDL5_APHGO|nr:unnamed protein product [Aphis gossypii]
MMDHSVYINSGTRNIIAVVNAMRKLVVSSNYYYTRVRVFVCVYVTRVGTHVKPGPIVAGTTADRPTIYIISYYILLYIIHVVSIQLYTVSIMHVYTSYTPILCSRGTSNDMTYGSNEYRIKLVYYLILLFTHRCCCCCCFFIKNKIYVFTICKTMHLHVVQQ